MQKEQINNRTKLWAMSDEEVLARLIYGENRSSRQGMEEVASVVMNRVQRPRRFGGSQDAGIKAICLRPWQFSCFWEHKPLQACIDADLTTGIGAECLEIARGHITGELSDTVSGADHYHNKSMTPGWAESDRLVMVQDSRNETGHIFYREQTT